MSQPACVANVQNAAGALGEQRSKRNAGPARAASRLRPPWPPSASLFVPPFYVSLSHFRDRNFRQYKFGQVFFSSSSNHGAS
jgi:hypothetical protein